MTIPFNVNKYISKKLAKVFRLDFDALHEGLNTKGFFTGKKVDMKPLNISTYRVKKSSLLQDLTLLGFMSIEYGDCKVNSIQLSENFIHHLGEIGPLEDPKYIKRYIHATIRIAENNNYTDNVRLFKELIDSHLPTGYEILAYDPWHTTLTRFDFIIVQLKSRPMDFFKDIEKIYKVASYINLISKRHITISVDDMLMKDNEVMFKQYSVSIKFADSAYSIVFNDPNFKNTKLALLEERLNQNN